MGHQAMGYTFRFPLKIKSWQLLSTKATTLIQVWRDGFFPYKNEEIEKRIQLDGVTWGEGVTKFGLKYISLSLNSWLSKKATRGSQSWLDSVIEIVKANSQSLINALAMCTPLYLAINLPTVHHGEHLGLSAVTKIKPKDYGLGRCFPGYHPTFCSCLEFENDLMMRDFQDNSASLCMPAL